MLVRPSPALLWTSTCALSFWLMSWQELGRSIWGKWSGSGIQIISLQQDNDLSVECCWTENRSNPLWPREKTITENVQLWSYSTEIAACYRGLCHYDPSPVLRVQLLFGILAPLSNSLVFWLSLLSTRDWHRWRFVWEQWYGGWALACCQLFWWFQIASAPVG